MATCLSLVGAFVTKKWLVAPESIIAHSWIFLMPMLTVDSSAFAASVYVPFVRHVWDMGVRMWGFEVGSRLRVLLLT